MFRRQNIKNINLRVLEEIGEIHISPSLFTYKLVVKIGEFNIAQAEPTLFINLLANQSKFTLGDLVFSLKNKYTEIPLLNVYYILHVTEDSLIDSEFINIVNRVKDEISLVSSAYDYIRNYELALNYTKSKSKSPASDNKVSGINLDYIKDFINNIDNKDNNENSN